MFNYCEGYYQTQSPHAHNMTYCSPKSGTFHFDPLDKMQSGLKRFQPSANELDKSEKAIKALKRIWLSMVVFYSVGTGIIFIAWVAAVVRTFLAYWKYEFDPYDKSKTSSSPYNDGWEKLWFRGALVVRTVHGLAHGRFVKLTDNPRLDSSV